MTTKLAIANEYGDVDLTRYTLPKNYVHVKGLRLQPLCRKLKIKFCEAVIGFDGYGGKPNKRYSPIKAGVVISRKSEAKLLAAIEARQARSAARPKRPAFRMYENIQAKDEELCEIEKAEVMARLEVMDQKQNL